MRIELLDFLTLFQSACVIMVLAYVLTRTAFFAELLDGRRTLRNRAILAAVFGLFSIYGTLTGVPFLGAVITIRDLGPMLAGLIAGPVTGLAAGCIGAFHRLTLGGPTALGGSVSTVAAGVIGGLVFMLRKGRLPATGQAAAVAAGIECFHMVTAVLLSDTLAVGLAVAKTAAFPMIAANVVGMAVFVLIVRNLLIERATSRAKEALESELKVARDIQMSIVPRLFPPFPDRPELELYAVLDSAKEVGGDFYDYYALDADRIFFVIGDVAGKGVPASLFMAVTMTLFKAYVRPDRGPAQVLAKVNDKLGQDNETGLFVTAFCGIIDLSDGRIAYASGGHNLPVVLRGDGRVDFAPKVGGLVLGAVPGQAYRTGEAVLAPGDTVLLYTDGVTEAMNEGNELFGNERLLAAAGAMIGREPKGLVEGMLERLRAYAGDAPQSDDITMLALRYRGRRPEPAT